jgi:UDP-N-acetylmuramoyl-tripeptide--D-alanyl-D-alanine ligase
VNFVLLTVIFKLIYIAVFVFASFTAFLRFMHIFQQNSYKPDRFLRWLSANKQKVLFLLILPKSTPAIKPLVYTARVKRMIITNSILLAIAAVFTFILKIPANAFLLPIIFILSPIMPIVSNGINFPIESNIRRYYINDAKRILRAFPNLIVIGITGSFGKTSVKYFLTTLLKAKYNVLMTPESFNTPMGVVKTIREELRSTHEIFVCEMGARQAGDIREICDIVHPTHGIITSIGEQHLETFGNIENIIKTKFELADTIKDNGIIFLNGDNDYIRKNLPSKNHITYGINTDNNTYAYDIKSDLQGTIFSINADKGEHLQTSLIGAHNVTNICGAIAVCLYLGVPMDGIRERLRKLSAPPHRLELKIAGGMTIIDDAYNSNPAGCEAALTALALFDETKILITPGMVELGERQEALNREFGRQAAAICDYIFLVGTNQTKPIAEGVLKAGFDNEKLTVTESFKEAFAKAQSLKTDRAKVILIENDLPDNYL